MVACLVTRGMTVTNVYPETGMSTTQTVHGEGAPMAEPGFDQMLERHRRELHVHCYRMLGSFTDAEDLVQETFLRVWRNRDAPSARDQPAGVAVPDRHERVHGRHPQPPPSGRHRLPRRPTGCPPRRPTGCPPPPAACAWPQGVFRAFKLGVLRVRGSQVAETTTFDSSLFGAFGLPEVLPEEGQ